VRAAGKDEPKNARLPAGPLRRGAVGRRSRGKPATPQPPVVHSTVLARFSLGKPSMNSLQVHGTRDKARLEVHPSVSRCDVAFTRQSGPALDQWRLLVKASLPAKCRRGENQGGFAAVGTPFSPRFAPEARSCESVSKIRAGPWERWAGRSLS